jgi:predicted O-methyltransferase YrrM
VFVPFEIIKYYLTAKGRHGIHSPYVYDFTDKCLKLDVDLDFIGKRNELYNQLLTSKQKILVNDQGSGSKKLNKQRKVSEIFKFSSSKGKYADLLFKISKYYKPNTILELGTSVGVGTIHLQAGNPNSKIITVEACSETLRIAQSNFQLFDYSIETKNYTFNYFLENLQNNVFDLIYIDGHHDGQALLNYLNLLQKHIHNETIILLDDIRWSESMINAWREIYSSSAYHVSMDLFRMGIIVPRNQQTKQHFTIKL